eukprot:SAG31_NODE_12662_length_926_cov_0.857316_1_plen_97_part_01
MADPNKFEETLRLSLRLLQGANGQQRSRKITLLSLHGLNSPTMVEWATREGGCCDVLDRLRKEGLFSLIGFSTHADTDVIVHAIESGRFDYVNLHAH